eukprot:917125-Pelagomonas_calceolata.AAC.3
MSGNGWREWVNAREMATQASWELSKIFRAGGPNAFGPLLSLQRSPQHNSWSLAAHAWAA